MIRKCTIGLIAAASLVLAVFAPGASAQDPPCDYANYIAYNCVGQAGGYPENGFTPRPTPTPQPTPQPTSSAASSADNVEATSTGSTSGASIAFTGSESRVLGYVGAGLIGFGAIALVAARRKGESDIDLS